MAKTAFTAFVVCLRNEGAEDLEIAKVYQAIPDDDATGKGFVRVIDESGEDYLYPEAFFAPVEIPEAAASQLRSARTKK